MKMKIALVAGTAMSVAAAANAQMLNNQLGAAGAIVHSAQAHQAPLPNPGITASPIAQLLYDGTSTAGSAAQEFEAAFAGYNIYIIEDFTTSQDFDLDEFTSTAFGTGNPFAATDFVLRIFAQPGGGTVCPPGGAPVATSVPGTGFFDGIDYRTNMGGVCLPAGSYQAVWHVRMDFQPNGQAFFFQQAGAHNVGGGNANNAIHWNPGGNFGFICQNIQDFFVGGNIGVNFTLTGDPGNCGGGGCPWQDPTCPGDWNGDGSLDGADFFAFLDDFVNQAPCADINGDGQWDSTDFFLYLDAFVFSQGNNC